MRPGYPFAALVGQEQLKTALLLNALSPGIGGVLIRGEKGTAKSTAARALAGLLPPIAIIAGCPFHCDPAAPWAECPHCSAVGERQALESAVPFVDLPIGATEDRVLGTLDFEKALREGRRAFQPGLLAAAHRGVLYIDEVNLLPDHLVDVLLDAAALGVNSVQREGVSVVHPAQFVLIGTMNPEEGNLRPQLLDRFGLMVEVVSPREAELRTEIVRRRIAFETDPAVFASHWESGQMALRERLRTARELLPQVGIANHLLDVVSRLCCEFEVEGLRADLVIHKAAQALAAWHGRSAVNLDDVKTAAELALPHRRGRRPLEPPHLDSQELARKLEEVAGPIRPEQTDEHQSEDQAGGSCRERTFDPLPPKALPQIEVAARNGNESIDRGRRNLASRQAHGQYVRAVVDSSADGLAVDATVRAAALHSLGENGQLEIRPDDIRRKERAGRTGTLILIAVDASGSMAARRRMELVKGVVLGLLKSANEQRDEVGVIAFRGVQAEVLLPPTDAVELVEQTLRVLPTGGRTPLAHALVLGLETVAQARRARPGQTVMFILLSDGKANVALPDSNGDPWQQSLRAAAALAAERIPALVLDTEVGYVRQGRAQEVACVLHCECLSLENFTAEQMVLKLRQWQNGVPT
jgi:magnesium chelatase subunit D